MPEVKREATRRQVELVTVPTEKAIDLLNRDGKRVNAILHVTC